MLEMNQILACLLPYFLMQIYIILLSVLCMYFQDPEVVNVSLQSQDIIGLGFNISGNMRDGIFVSQVHNRGPASESGKIQSGIYTSENISARGVAFKGCPDFAICQRGVA